MEKELIKALIAMRYALKDVLDKATVQDTDENGQTIDIVPFNTDYAAQCDLEAMELLTAAGVEA